MVPCNARFSCGKRLRTSLGFTYLWVLFTVAAIGLSLSLAAELYVTSTQRDKEKELLAIGRQFRQAIASYSGNQGPVNPTQYPPSLEDLLKDPRSPTPRRHLRKIFVDPMTGKSEWGLFKLGGRIAGIYSLSQQSPIKQGGFEADDVGFSAKQKYSEWVFTYPADLMVRPVPNPTAIPGNSPGTLPTQIPASTASNSVIGGFSPPPITNSTSNGAVDNSAR